MGRQKVYPEDRVTVTIGLQPSNPREMKLLKFLKSRKTVKAAVFELYDGYKDDSEEEAIVSKFMEALSEFMIGYERRTNKTIFQLQKTLEGSFLPVGIDTRQKQRVIDDDDDDDPVSRRMVAQAKAMQARRS